MRFRVPKAFCAEKVCRLLRYIGAVAPLLIVLWLSGVGFADAAPLVVRGLGRAAVPVDGTWQFHEGDDPKWAAPGLDDSGWQPIEVGRPWEGQGHVNLTGFAWYRRHIVLDGVRTPGWDVALSISNVEDAAEVYWNGRQVGSFGRVPPHAVWYGLENTFPVICVLGRSDEVARQGVLAIRVWKAPYAYAASGDMGGLKTAPLLGEAGALVAQRRAAELEWLRSSLYLFALALLSSVVSLVALLGWLRNRRQWMLLWLAIFAIRALALMFVLNRPWIPWRFTYGAVGITFTATDVALWFLLLYLLGLRANTRLVWWTRVLGSLAVALQVSEGLLQFFDWERAPKLFLHLDVAFTVPCFVLDAYGIVLIAMAFRNRLNAARWLLAITALLADILTNLPSIFGLGQRWTHWTLAQTITTPLFRVGGNSFDVTTIASTLVLVSIVYAAWRFEQERAQRQKHVDEELHNAQAVQRVLIPDSVAKMPGFSFSSAYRPAQEVGGDFFQLLPLAGGAALLVLGDVSGKGLHAAMTVAMVVGAIRSTVETTSDPAQVLAALNRLLHGHLRNGFATCVVLRIEGDGKCALANAGHLPPFLNGSEVELPQALPLGLLAEADYETTVLYLDAGDRLTLYTDGVLEARSENGELFGFARVAELLATSPDAAEIADAAQAFGQEDDITVLTMGFAPVVTLQPAD